MCEKEESRKTFKSTWWMALSFLSLLVISLRVQVDLHVLLFAREWCFPSLFLTRGFVNRLRPSHYNQLSTPGPPWRSGPKCADASKISKWCICTTRWILDVELMIISGRDRCCQKVTRHQGNGLLQSARFDEGGRGGRMRRGGGKRKEPEEDGERQRERTIKRENTTLNIFKAIKHFFFLFHPSIMRATTSIWWKCD